MTNVELIFLGVGLVLILIAAIIVAKSDFMSGSLLKIVTIMAITGLFFVVGAGISYTEATTETETEKILITISDKNTERRRAGKVSRTHYYFYFFIDENTENKVQVDFSTYNKYDINDTIVITKTTTYNIDRDTKEREFIMSVEYN